MIVTGIIIIFLTGVLFALLPCGLVDLRVWAMLSSIIYS